jgi:hypothetical protein
MVPYTGYSVPDLNVDAWQRVAACFQANTAHKRALFINTNMIPLPDLPEPPVPQYPALDSGAGLADS